MKKANVKTYKTFINAIASFIHICTYRSEIEYPELIYCHKTKKFIVSESMMKRNFETVICYNDEDGITFKLNDEELIKLLSNK